MSRGLPPDPRIESLLQVNQKDNVFCSIYRFPGAAPPDHRIESLLQGHQRDKVFCSISNHFKKKTKLAVVSGSEEITFKELDIKVNLLANNLQEKGIRKGKIVSIFLSPSIEFVISILAVLKTGAAYVPISIKTPLERIKNIIKSSDSNLIIFNGEQQVFLKKVDCDVLNFETLDFSKQYKDITVQFHEND